MSSYDTGLCCTFFDILSCLCSYSCCRAAYLLQKLLEFFGIGAKKKRVSKHAQSYLLLQFLSVLQIFEVRMEK